MRKEFIGGIKRIKGKCGVKQNIREGKKFKQKQDEGEQTERREEKMRKKEREWRKNQAWKRKDK